MGRLTVLKASPAAAGAARRWRGAQRHEPARSARRRVAATSPGTTGNALFRARSVAAALVAESLPQPATNSRFTSSKAKRGSSAPSHRPRGRSSRRAARASMSERISRGSCSALAAASPATISNLGPRAQTVPTPARTRPRPPAVAVSDLPATAVLSPALRVRALCVVRRGRGSASQYRSTFRAAACRHTPWLTDPRTDGTDSRRMAQAGETKTFLLNHCEDRARSCITMLDCPRAEFGGLIEHCALDRQAGSRTGELLPPAGSAPRRRPRSVASGIEDYYLAGPEAAGEWIGGLTRALELGGPAGERELRLVLDGRSPDSGDLLTRRPLRVPGFDVTFSAPKSVSVLFGISENGVRSHVQRHTTSPCGTRSRTWSARRR